MNEIRCFLKVTLVPLGMKQPSKGPFECGSFRALPDAFIGYPDVQETGDPNYVDMQGVPYVVIAEVAVGLK